jgi:hypothetical protein
MSAEVIRLRKDIEINPEVLVAQLKHLLPDTSGIIAIRVTKDGAYQVFNSTMTYGEMAFGLLVLQRKINKYLDEDKS